MWKLLIVIVAAIAVLSQLEVSQNQWVVSKSLSLKSSVEDTYNFITSLDYVDKVLHQSNSYGEVVRNLSTSFKRQINIQCFSILFS